MFHFYRSRALQMAYQEQRQIERLVAEAISRRLGTTDWSFEALDAEISVNVDAGIATFSLDGVDVMELRPTECLYERREHQILIHAVHRYRYPGADGDLQGTLEETKTHVYDFMLAAPDVGEAEAAAPAAVTKTERTAPGNTGVRRAVLQELLDMVSTIGLDVAVAAAEGWTWSWSPDDRWVVERPDGARSEIAASRSNSNWQGHQPDLPPEAPSAAELGYFPSTDLGEAMRLLVKYELGLKMRPRGGWNAFRSSGKQRRLNCYGDTPGIAICRAVIAIRQESLSIFKAA